MKYVKIKVSDFEKIIKRGKKKDKYIAKLEKALTAYEKEIDIYNKSIAKKK